MEQSTLIVFLATTPKYYYKINNAVIVAIKAFILIQINIASNACLIVLHVLIIIHAIVVRKVDLLILLTSSVKNVI